MASACDQERALLLDLRAHLLLGRHRERASPLGSSLRDLFVRFGLLGHQLGADVGADIDVGDVDREDVERRAAVQAAREHVLGDACPGSREPRRSSVAEPIVETMPSPTRATTVSSVAPPTSRSMLERTVIRVTTKS